MREKAVASFAKGRKTPLKLSFSMEMEQFGGFCIQTPSSRFTGWFYTSFPELGGTKRPVKTVVVVLFSTDNQN